MPTTPNIQTAATFRKLAPASLEEYGQARLTEFLCASLHLPPASLIAPLVAAVHDFSGGEQANDITLVVARCRA